MVLDNASNNDTAVSHIFKHFNKPHTYVKTQCLRCFGHILNLVIKAFLFSTDADAFEAHVFTAYTLQVKSDELAAWRKQGSVGKLYNIVQYI